MNINKLSTPQFLVDREALHGNIARYQDAAKKNGKLLMPMTKTHKSTAIAKMQADAGAAGFLVGTLIEAEKLMPLGLPIILAYPFIGAANIARIIEIAKKCELYLSLDGVDAAFEYDAALKAAGMTLKFYLLIDSGLHRLGVSPENAGRAAKEIAEKCDSLIFHGIASHPGQVYGCETPAVADAVANDELTAFERATASLEAANVQYSAVASGSTPTYFQEAESGMITVLHPGNYVFNDVIQLALGAAQEVDCAFSVLATVIAHPAPDRFILDCGSKCLGLDKGAHGNASIVGFGRIVGHDELSLVSLSEEISKVSVDAPTTLKVGDKVRVIPNHSCSAANMCSYMVLTSGNETVGIIETDMRGNSVMPVIE